MKTKRRLAWLLALFMTAALFACCFAFLDMRYAVNDDAGILKAFLGYETGTPARFHIYIHGLLALPLSLLGTAFPGIAWFSVMQLALLFLAFTVAAKSVMQCFVNREKPLWAGALFAALFLALFGLRFLSRITFTQTAALLGAAAVLQMLSIDHARASSRKVVVGMAGALALVVLGYSLRQITALPILAFCGLTFVYVACEYYGFAGRAKRALRPLVVSLVMVAVVMGGMVGVRAWEIERSGAKEYLAWQKANTPVIDYYGVNSVTDEMAEAVGWTPMTRRLAKDWCFLDSRLTTESFEQLAQMLEKQDKSTFLGRLTKAGETVSQTARANRDVLRLFGPAALVLLMCFAGAALTRRLYPALAAALGVLLAALMLLYLALGGRLPLHAALMALLPLAALVFGLLPACLPNGLCKTQAMCALLTAAYAAFALSGAVPPLIKDPAEEERMSPMAMLEESALNEPECLFIYDYDIAATDARLFPDYSQGVPHNVTFWGGWALRSPQSIEQFRAFGIDLAHFDPAVFLREDVYLATGGINPDRMPILDWVIEEADPNADAILMGEFGNLCLFQFY